jgi:hypothetical protein
LRLKRKIPAFVFGVSIGLIIGGGFFIFRINEVFNKFSDKASAKITVIEQPVTEIRHSAPEKKRIREIQRQQPEAKSEAAEYKVADSLIHEDTDVKIATEELITVKTVKVIRIGDKIAGSDSSRTADAPQDDLYFIEFWRTPLNSRGYRFSRNKILLYGFSDYSNVLLYELDNAYYIKSGGHVYKVFYTGEFKPLERVIDSDLLARIS